MLRYLIVVLLFSFCLLGCSTSQAEESMDDQLSSIPTGSVDSLPQPVKQLSLEEIDSLLSAKDLPLTAEGNYQAEDWRTMLHPRYITGRFKHNEFPDMLAVPHQYTDGDGTYYMHRLALDSFKVMHAAAKKDDVKLMIVSAFRNFSRQKVIWEAKWKGQRLLEGKEKANEVYPHPAERALAILRYSSMPSTSRHHWGTDIDLNRLSNAYFASGEGLKTYNWLIKHASKYGFCQTYTAKGEQRPNGYEEEKWHWSFLPIAQALTEYARKNMVPLMISGFAGSEVADSIQVIDKYVLGINKACNEK